MNTYITSIQKHSHGAFLWSKKHRYASASIIIATLVVLYYIYSMLFAAEAQTIYTVSTVGKGDISVSVTGSGQISSEKEILVSAKVSGDMAAVYVKNGDTVRTGQTIAVLDSREAQKAVRDALVNLESAQLSLKKLQQPAETLTVIEAEHALLEAQENKTDAEEQLIKSYDDSYNSIANTFLELPTVMTGLQDILYGSTASGSNGSMWNGDYYASNTKSLKAPQYKEDAYVKYDAARVAYEKTLTLYKSSSRNSSQADVEELLSQS
jgi:multidrug resistance efflux pump